MVCWDPTTMKQGMIFLYLMDLKLKTWRISSTVGRYTGSVCILSTKENLKFFSLESINTYSCVMSGSSPLQFDHLPVSSDRTRVY